MFSLAYPWTSPKIEQRPIHILCRVTLRVSVKKYLKVLDSIYEVSLIPSTHTGTLPFIVLKVKNLYLKMYWNILESIPIFSVATLYKKSKFCMSFFLYFCQNIIKIYGKPRKFLGITNIFFLKN